MTPSKTSPPPHPKMEELLGFVTHCCFLQRLRREAREGSTNRRTWIIFCWLKDGSTAILFSIWKRPSANGEQTLSCFLGTAWNLALLSFLQFKRRSCQLSFPAKSENWHWHLQGKTDLGHLTAKLYPSIYPSVGLTTTYFLDPMNHKPWSCLTRQKGWKPWNI